MSPEEGIPKSIKGFGADLKLEFNSKKMNLA